jgi:hypothetical protein
MVRPQLTYANVASTAALVIAVAGGTAIAVGGAASSVDGVSAGKISFVRNAKLAPVKYKTFFRLGGLQIQARCVENSGHFLDERVRSARKNAEVHVSVTGLNQGTPDVEYVTDVDFDKGDKLDIPETIQGNGTVVTVTFSTPKAAHVTATFQRNVAGGTLGGTKICLIGGTALFAP